MSESARNQGANALTCPAFSLPPSVWACWGPQHFCSAFFSYSNSSSQTPFLSAAFHQRTPVAARHNYIPTSEEPSFSPPKSISVTSLGDFGALGCRFTTLPLVEPYSLPDDRDSPSAVQLRSQAALVSTVLDFLLIQFCVTMMEWRA